MAKPKNTLTPGSTNDELTKIPIDTRVYFEFDTKEKAVRFMRTVSTKSRYPDQLKGAQFTCALFLTIAANDINKQTWMIKVERTQ